MAIMSLAVPLVLLSTPHLAPSPQPRPVTALHAPTFPQATSPLRRDAARLGWSRSAVPAHAAHSPSRGPGRSAATGVPDGAGGLYISWIDYRDGSGDVYLSRVTNAGATAPGWPADGLAVCAAPGEQGEPVLLPDGANGVIVGWLDYRDDWFAADAYGQRVSAAGLPQWTTDGVKVLDGAGMFDYLTAGSDGAGGVLLAWSVLADVYALRIDGTGAVAAGWSPAGVVVCDDPDPQSAVAVTHDGSGGAVVAWVDDRAGSTAVYAQRLNATGVAQWTADGIEVEAAPAGVWELAIASLGSGHSVVAWLGFGEAHAQRLDGAGAPQWNAGASTVLYSGGGAGSPDGDIRCVADGVGGAIVAWRSNDGIGYGIRAQRVNGAGAVQWTAAGASVAELPAGPFVSDLDVAADGAGGGLFSWSDDRGVLEYDVRVQKVSAAGAVAWTANGVAAGAVERQQLESVAAPDGAGGMLVSWVDNRTEDDEIFSQRFDAAGAPQLAANGVRTVTDPGKQHFAQVLQTGDGGALLIWNDKLGDQYDIRARKLAANGSPLAAPTLVASGPGAQELMGSVDDGAGGAIVLWRNPDFTYFAQRIDGNAALLWPPGGVELATGANINDPPRMTADGAGGAIFAWPDYRSGISMDIYAQRIDAAGARAWGAGGLGICTHPASQWGPLPVSDGAGGAFLVWSDQRVSQREIYAQRVDAAGAAQWTANGLLVAAYDGMFDSAYPVAAAPAPSNSAILLITEYVLDLMTFSSTHVLHAQKVDGTGATPWGPGGVTVCDAGSQTLSSFLVGDGSGGAFVAWDDSRNGHLDLYAQHVTSAGAADWNADGNVVCDAAGWQFLGGMTPVAGGDLVIAWTDFRGGQPDVYAHRLSAAGAPVWTANGVDVTPVARGQYAPSLAPWKTATPERLYLAWTDNRAGDTRYAYAERLDLNGVPQWAPSGVTGTQLALASAEAGPDRVRLVWHASEAVTATVQRRPENGAWATLATVRSDGSGRIEYVDEAVVPGGRYEYRLGVREGDGEVFVGAVWVQVPASLALAIEGLRPNPAVGDPVVAFTLPRAGAARIELVDVSGRRVRSEEFAGLDAGRHLRRLGGPKPAPGVYFLRLTHEGRTVTARATVIE